MLGMLKAWPVLEDKGRWDIQTLSKVDTFCHAHRAEAGQNFDRVPTGFVQRRGGRVFAGLVTQSAHRGQVHRLLICGFDVLIQSVGRRKPGSPPKSTGRCADIFANGSALERVRSIKVGQASGRKGLNRDR
jgi:hypothetical protein